MHVLIVEAQVKAGMRDAFLAAILDDAWHSVADEPGCLRFDVVQSVDDPDRFFFYEVYADAAAIDAHVQTPHFLRFDAELPGLVQRELIKTVATTVHTGGGP